MTATILLTLGAMSSEVAPAAAPSGAVGGAQADIRATIGAEVGITIAADGRTAAVGSVRAIVTRQQRGSVVVTTIVAQ